MRASGCCSQSKEFHVSLFLKRLSTTLSLCAALIAPAFAATTGKTHPQISVRPKARVTEAVDLKKITTLANTHPSLVDGLADQGRVASSTQFNHMLLVLKSSDEQEFALQALLDQQQDRNHANFHQWVTPETFGAAFGVESSDIEQVKGWLEQSGFTVNSVSKSGRLIDFSGASGAVESAFHTQMHQYQVKGEMRISNSTDISIPAAFMGVVAGPAALNNFRAHSNAVSPKKIALNHGKPVSATSFSGGAPVPLTSDGQGDNYVGAADLQVLYDSTPLYAKGIDGTGQTIGIIAETDLVPADDQIYRSLFGLPPNPPVVVRVGNDSGISPGDDVESDLDVEMAGALAYNATVDFIIGGESYLGDGVFTSVAYAVDSNIPDVISMSYGLCESQSSAAGYITFFNQEFEQGAAQGQTSFVSSGDSGPNTCDNTTTPTSYSVTGWGDSPYTVSVGGTEFNESLNSSFTFWGSGGFSVPYENALATPPEVPWNQWPVYGDGTQNDAEGSSGISFYFNTPNYQTGPGVPTTDPTPPSGSIPAASYKTAGSNHRYLPDISSNASDDLDGTIFCSEGSCTINSDGSLGYFGVVGGTSVSAPTMASAQALINQANGGRQGQANYYYYRVAAAQASTAAKEAACSSTTYVATATTACGFHDVVNGNNFEPTNSIAIPYIGWNTNPGYDMAVGLGSPDIAQLAALWSTVTFNATTTTLALTPTTTQAHGASYSATITVAPAGTSTKFPTGQVAIYATTSTGAPVAGHGSATYYTLSGTSNTLTATLTGLPGGAINVYAHYTGDTTFGGSTSAPVAVTVTPEAPKVLLTSYSLSTGAAVTATANFTYGQTIFLQGGVNPSTGVGVPSGNTTYTLVTGGTTLPTLTTALEPDLPVLGNTIGSQAYISDSSLISGNAAPNDGVVNNYPVLAIGTYTATMAYAGDASFSAASSPTITFTVGLAASALTVTPATAEIASGATAVIGASVAAVANLDGGAPPTGTVTFSDTTVPATPIALGSGTLALLNSGASANTSISTNLIVGAPGAHTITAVYSGDSHYAMVTKTGTVTIGGTGSLITLTTTATNPQVLTPVPLTVTIPASETSSTVTTGTAYIYDGAVQIGTVTLGRGAATGTTTLTNLAAGTHRLTATYSGNATNQSATSAVLTVTVGKNTPALQLSVENNNTHLKSLNTAMSASLQLTPANISATSGAPFAAVPVPTGAITFSDALNGAASKPLGTAPLVYQGDYTGYYIGSYVATAGLAPGNHVITSSYPGDANYAAVTSNTDTVGIGITTTTLALTASGSGSSVTINIAATVAPVVTPQTPALTGTVSFYKNTVSAATLISTQTLSSGTASINLAYPTTQTAIIAVYSGDANYYTSQSTTTTIAGYVISVNPTSATMSTKGAATVTVTATSYGGYTGTGSLSCSGLPANTFCPYNDVVQWTFSGVDGAQPISLTITAFNSQAGSTPVHAGLLWLPAVLLAGLLAFGRKRLTVRGRQLLTLAVLFCGMLAVNGCSGGNDYSKVTTPTGSYNVTLISNGTGANAASPNLTTTAALSLQVQ